MSSIVKDPEEFQSLEDLEAKDNETQVDALEKEISDDVPEKFKGKSVSDVAKAYSELEKRFGQQGNELGELRRLTDDIIKKQLDTKEKVEDISDEDFYESPREAVDKVVSNHPSLKRLDDLERSIAEREFTNNHPEWRNTASSEDFTNWVASSPLRIRLYSNADKFDFDSANELFNLWEERKSLIKSAAEKEKEIQEEKRKKDLKSATSESSSTEGSSKKVFDRRELIRMKMYEPDKYESMQDEIMQAYAEGRIK